MIIWKDVVGYENLYQVSNTGKVRSLPRNGTIKKIRIKSQMTDKDGYKIVKLRKNNNPKMKKVHRLVAEAFLEKVERKDIVDHINSIKDDNRVENLRWVSNRENVLYGKTKFKGVLQLKDGRIIDCFLSLREAERETAISRYKIKNNLSDKFEFIVLQEEVING